MQLPDLKNGLPLVGVEPSIIVSAVAVVPIGTDAVQLSAQKCGWDLTSYPPAGADGRQSEPLHIEVKGRVKGATTVTITRNEILYALNQAEKFVLAIVLVSESDTVEGPFYLTSPFTKEPDWGVSSINYDLGELLAKASRIR